MIGILFQALGELVKSNPGLVGHAMAVASKESGLSKKIDDMITAPSEAEVIAKQKREDAERRRKERVEQEKHDEELYNLAIEMEKEHLIETNEEAKNFEEDILLEFSAKRLTENLPVRIDEYSQQKEMIDSEIAEIDRQIAEMEDAALEEHAKEESDKKLEVERRRVRKLNSMYETYVTVCDQDGNTDDVGTLSIMAAMKKLGVSDEEMAAIKKFASKHEYSASAQYLKEPKRSVRKKSVLASDQIAATIQELAADRETKAEQSELLGELIAVLAKRIPKDDAYPRKQGRRNKQQEVIPEEVAIDVQSDDGCVSHEEASQKREGSGSVIDTILQVFESCRGVEGLEELYIGQDIPDDKLNNAAESMKIKENEVAILWDTTVFGSAKDGMLVTEKAVYFKNLWADPKRYAWNRILKLKNDGDGDFSIGNFTFNTSDEDAANAVYDALITIAQTIC